MTLTYTSVLDHGLEPSAALLTEGFTGYFVPIQIPPAGLLMMVRGDAVDLSLSRVIFQSDKPVGAALIARRGWTSRLAAMSIIPDARGKGIGQESVNHLLAEARARGDQAMTLEVIEQNTPAVKLYQKCGFQTIRRLVGYVGQPTITDADNILEPVDIREVARHLTAYAPPDIPWQISGEALASAGPPSVAYRNAFSFVVLTNPDAPTIGIRAIVTELQHQRKGSATALLRSVIAHYPNKQWRVSPTFPEELGALYEKIGLQRDTLSQWQMSATL